MLIDSFRFLSSEFAIVYVTHFPGIFTIDSLAREISSYASLFGIQKERIFYTRAITDMINSGRIELKKDQLYPNVKNPF